MLIKRVVENIISTIMAGYELSLDFAVDFSLILF